MNEYFLKFKELNNVKNDIDVLITALMSRELLTREYAWAIPNDLAISTISKYSPLIEIGAGAGYWAKLLSEAGADILAFDSHPPTTTNNPYKHTKTWYPIQEGSPEKILDYPDRTLFLCWAPYEQPMANDCLNNYKNKYLIWVGELNGGCCGDKKFWNNIKKNFHIKNEIDIPQWYGIHDCLVIFERNHD